MASRKLGEAHERRIVITGMGVITAAALDLKHFWHCVRSGISGAKPMTRFPAGVAPTQFAAQIEGFEPGDYMDAKLARRLDYSHRYGVAAARLAQQDAGVDFGKVDADRVGIVEGSSMSGNEGAVKAEEGFHRSGYKGVGPFALINGYSGAGSGEIARELNVRGHSVTLSSSSASGNDALGYALNMIRYEEVDVMVAGGAEAPIVPHTWGGLCLNKVMSRRNDAPAAAMRPFRQEPRRHFTWRRSGLPRSRGALLCAKSRRGIYAEILGHGRSCEATIQSPRILMASATFARWKRRFAMQGLIRMKWITSMRTAPRRRPTTSWRPKPSSASSDHMLIAWR
jgi:3-oxoacyl-[acyl-carrier-protein] synthase II